jgi:hypothetical protein
VLLGFLADLVGNAVLSLSFLGSAAGCGCALTVRLAVALAGMWFLVAFCFERAMPSVVCCSASHFQLLLVLKRGQISEDKMQHAYRVAQRTQRPVNTGGRTLNWAVGSRCGQGGRSIHEREVFAEVTLQSILSAVSRRLYRYLAHVGKAELAHGPWAISHVQLIGCRTHASSTHGACGSCIIPNSPTYWAQGRLPQGLLSPDRPHGIPTIHNNMRPR